MGIYLDNASTSVPKKEVLEVMKPYFDSCWFNPSSVYLDKNGLRGDIERVRKITLDYLNAGEEDTLIFTSGATESNNIAIKGIVEKEENMVFLTTKIEHSSIIEIAKQLNKMVFWIDVNKDGSLDIDYLEDVCKTLRSIGYKFLFSIHMVNNEIGTVQNIRKISDIVHRYGGILHADATQALGKIPLNVTKEGIDLLSASGHKIGTPKGIGILYIKQGIECKPLICGKQEFGLRGGTENVPYIVAFGKAIELASKNDYYNSMVVAEKRSFTIRLLKNMIPNCKINCEHSLYPTDIISVTYPQDVLNENLVICLTLLDIYVATGSACNSYDNEKSHVLKNIGLSDDEIDRTIRISIGEHLSYTDITNGIQGIKGMLDSLKERENL